MKLKPNPRTCLTGLGALLALGTSVHGVDIPTSFGNGADTYLSNDGNSGPTVNHGGEAGMNLREWDTVRMRHLYIRFDISGVQGDLSGATITLNGTTVNRNRPLDFYGVLDGATAGEGENWNEGTVTFNTAAGLPTGDGTAPDTVFTADATPTRIASTAGSAVGLNTTAVSTDLDNFIAADTDGLITFIVTLEQVNNDSEDFTFSTKEGGTAPYITFPNASLGDADGDGMGDAWEIASFGSTTFTDDPSADLDTDDGTTTGNPMPDGFTNAQEEAAGSDPLNFDSVPDDIDGDDLSDTWEDTYFGDGVAPATTTELAAQDGTGDPDNDKGTNEEEETAGTNPTDRASFLDDEGPGVGDGLNDWWEIHYFSDTATATATTGDPDGDTEDNATEYTNFSNPNNIDSIAGDIDGDGINDLFEDQYFGNNDGIIDDSPASLAELATADATSNSDGDVFTDLEESLATPPSDPTDANSVPDDADNDGLSDAWELTYFADIFGQNGFNDSDNDLYTNEEEETAGLDSYGDPCDPTDILSFPDDADTDDQNDRWEELYFGNGNGIVEAGELEVDDDPSGDPDNDLFVNQDEYEGFGTDPSYFGYSNPNLQASTPDDVEGDGLLDTDEIFYFGDIYTYDATDDPDGDKGTNLDEQNDLTDPTDRADTLDVDNGGGGDGLGDYWELWSFGDLTTTELGTDDNDNDGFDNDTEFAASTNGNDPTSTPDTDADGLPDGWEVTFFIQGGEDPIADLATIIARQSGADDSDAGGTSNLIEFYAGTNPNDGGADDETPIERTTADGNGADSALSNDGTGGGGPNDNHGAAGSLQIRYFTDARLFFAILRFDVNGLSGDLSNALLQLNVTNAGRTRTWGVYGLVDGDPGENWDESTITYANAPGIIEADRGLLNQFARDPQKLVRIGGFPVTQGLNQVYTSTPDELDLAGFIADDTDGQITLVIHDDSASGQFNFFDSKEGTIAPKLIFPLAEDADSDIDGLADSWENTYFGDLTSARGTEAQDPGLGADWDNDNDGDDNATEQANGTDPTDKGSFTDSEPDGLPDSWELTTFGDLDEDGGTDTDLDGFSNVEEFWAGTDADDINDVPVIPAASKAHHYTFNDDSFTDLVGGLDGTLDGAAAISGGALQLTGGTGELDAATLAINTYDSVTIEFWATSNDAVNTGFSALFGAGETNPANTNLASNYLLFATHRGDNNNRGAIGTNNQNGTPWLSEEGVNSAEINDNSEHHYVLVINDITKQLEWFVDGVSQGAVTTQQDLADVATEFASVGALYPADASWQGSVNEFAIYDGALTDAEVAASFAAGATVGAPASVAVTNVSLSGTTLSVTLEGLQNGSEYHWESSSTLGGFTAIPGSTFTGDGNPTQTELMTVDPLTNPKFFVRVAEGAAPAP